MVPNNDVSLPTLVVEGREEGQMVPWSCSLALEQSIGHGRGAWWEVYTAASKVPLLEDCEELGLKNKNIEIPFLSLSHFFPLQPCYR